MRLPPASVPYPPSGAFSILDAVAAYDQGRGAAPLSSSCPAAANATRLTAVAAAAAGDPAAATLPRWFATPEASQSQQQQQQKCQVQPGEQPEDPPERQLSKEEHSGESQRSEQTQAQTCASSTPLARGEEEHPLPYLPQQQQQLTHHHNHYQQQAGHGAGLLETLLGPQRDDAHQQQQQLQQQQQAQQQLQPQMQQQQGHQQQQQLALVPRQEHAQVQQQQQQQLHLQQRMQQQHWQQQNLLEQHHSQMHQQHGPPHLSTFTELEKLNYLQQFKRQQKLAEQLQQEQQLQLLAAAQRQQELLLQLQQQQQRQQQAQRPSAHPALRSAGASNICDLLGGQRRPLINAHLLSRGLLDAKNARPAGLEPAPAAKRRATCGGRQLPIDEDLLQDLGAVAGVLAEDEKRLARLMRERQRLAAEAPGPAFAGGTGRVRRGASAGRPRGEGDATDGDTSGDGGARPRRQEDGGAAASAEPTPPPPKPPKAPRKERKPSKPGKPWQPRAEKDEGNWRGAEKFEEFVSAAEASLQKAAAPKAWPRALPCHATARFVVVLLLHAPGWPNYRVWEQWAQAHPEGEVALFVHMKVRPVVEWAAACGPVCQADWWI